jgi:hypothetical protein
LRRSTAGPDPAASICSQRCSSSSTVPLVFIVAKPTVFE